MKLFCNGRTPDTHTCQLLSLSSLYQLSQVINEPTRVTETTSILIDLILSNNPETILSYGVFLHLGISDQRLVYALRKYEFPKSTQVLKEVRDFTNIFPFPSFVLMR